MPIGRRPVSRTDMYFPDVVVGEGMDCPVGSAVSIYYENEGRYYRRCGALDEDAAECFMGFVVWTGGEGQPLVVRTVRGAIAEPLVEGDAPLVDGQPVFLSVTPGRVTQTVPLAPGSKIVRVGFAISTTEIVLNNDARVENPA